MVTAMEVYRRISRSGYIAHSCAEQPDRYVVRHKFRKIRKHPIIHPRHMSLLQSLDVILEIKKRQVVGVGVFPLCSHAWVCQYNTTLAFWGEVGKWGGRFWVRWKKARCLLEKIEILPSG